MRRHQRGAARTKVAREISQICSHPKLIGLYMGVPVKIPVNNTPNGDGRWVAYVRTAIRRAIREIEAEKENGNAD